MTRLSPRGWFFAGLAATLAFRAWLSAAMPFTADEAYFVLWGRRPDLGFYDHPPMIGWWLAPLVAASDADWVARLPATLAPAALALAVRAAREPFAELAQARLDSVEALYLDQLMATRDANEGLQAFIEKRPPRWEHR